MNTNETLQNKLSSIINVERKIATYIQEAAPETINLSTAENVLLFDFYKNSIFNWQNRNAITLNDLRYPQQIFGSAAYQQSLADFLNNTWGSQLIEANDIYAVGGVSAALECLAFCLGEKGDSVISPAPLWYGFPWCFTQRAEMKFVPFYLTAAGIKNFQLTLEDVKKIYNDTNPKPRLLVLTNPNNPLGGNYSKELLEEIYDWVLKNTEMHIISDEIYFFSQATAGVSFVPAFNLDAVKRRDDNQRRVHIVWGLAKDFGMSGFKVGFIISKNKQVQDMMKGMETIKSMAWFTPFSSLAQYTLAPLFLDTAGGPNWTLARNAMKTYVNDQDALLQTQYIATKKALDDGRIHYYTQNNAAIFFWLDLRAFLNYVPASDDGIVLHPTIDPREDRLSKYIIDKSGVSLIPGQECYSKEPGYFRLCYTAQSKETVVRGITKMAEVLHALMPRNENS